jgi:hypothetical protein
MVFFRAKGFVKPGSLESVEIPIDENPGTFARFDFTLIRLD